ncbi:MAG: LarC family nickel insertion protein [Eubacterium sp.]
MKKTLYLECYSGISGDMAVGALLDLGADKDGLTNVLKSINADGFNIEISRVNKSGLDCCDFNVILDKSHENHDHDMEYLHGKDFKDNHIKNHHHRNLEDIKKIIKSTSLSDNAKNIAIKIFEIIADAEAKAHGKPIEQVHFHEVGAIDSIVDIIAFAYCFDNLNITDVIVPFLCDGWGNVRCQHGILPIPVPAVINISSALNIPIRITDIKGELVTPTGCAIVGAIRTDDTLPESFTVSKIGLGAGKREYKSSGILRAMIID